jgi:hypothetical protein
MNLNKKKTRKHNVEGIGKGILILINYIVK